MANKKTDLEDMDDIDCNDKENEKLSASNKELGEILQTAPIEKIGNFIEDESCEQSEAIQSKFFAQDDSPWYVEDDIKWEQMYNVNDAKQMEMEITNMGVGDRYSKNKLNNEIIGDVVKAQYPISRNINIGVNIDMSKMTTLFGSPEILAMHKRLEGQTDQYYCKDLRFALRRPVQPEVPIVPEFEFDYDNIFENIYILDEIEKDLKLIYRPFTCVVDVNCRFSLLELSILLENSRYDPAHHPALLVRLRNPSAEVKIYAGGKITSSALTADSARNALLKTIHMVDDLDYKTDITDFTQNIVNASLCLPFKIDLEMLSELHADQVSGNRQLRPFITYKIEGTAMRFAVFPNGFVIVLHSKQHSETRAAIAAFLPILAQFKNGYLTATEKYGSLCGDVSFRLLWERKLDEDKEGILLYS